eukprot:1154747-Pelagomonas_calceolata.AAC.9
MQHAHTIVCVCVHSWHHAGCALPPQPQSSLCIWFSCPCNTLRHSAPGPAQGVRFCCSLGAAGSKHKWQPCTQAWAAPRGAWARGRGQVHAHGAAAVRAGPGLTEGCAQEPARCGSGREGRA